MAMRWGKLYKGTPAELALEDAVAALGVPYRTQFPGYLFGFRYFPDFLLPTLGLVIEVDDDSHNKAAKIIADVERTEALNALGYEVVRCTNEEALSDPHGTVRALLQSVGKWPAVSNKLVRNTLPAVGRAPQRLKREAKSAALQRARAPSPKRQSTASTFSPLPALATA